MLFPKCQHNLVNFLPISEDAQQFGAGLRGNPIFGQLAHQRNRLAHLVEVIAATLAAFKMRFEARVLGSGERFLKIFGD